MIPVDTGFQGLGNLFNLPANGDSDYEADVQAGTYLLEIRLGPNAPTAGTLTWKGDPGGSPTGSHSMPGLSNYDKYEVVVPAGVTKMKFELRGYMGGSVYVNFTLKP